ncbi:conserved hypothetical protein [Histoplasma capsulatum var. duboisii H88]|uniref:Haloacid dehalogenase-like hydrolase n=1 Tax=Ajellomyces capsulatus (strain H88) TaxID=544711 RepID=F0UFD9_AJEC8|nr:conserved hypothetical protein [Histoplasma capsulatum var. duboisii H88]QSS55721.1 haloacid dehalogenase-like hydrolase [Histoplasma capsulatum var. duboisii H88]
MPPRILLLTLDAFHTLFHPRLPVPIQYAQVAQSLDFPPHLCRNNIPTVDLAAKISTAFCAAYKHESSTRPNFGCNVAGFGGPREWWGNVIRECFKTVAREDDALASKGKAVGGAEAGVEIEVPEELVQRLLKRFESREGYLLYPDVEAFMTRMRRWRVGRRLYGSSDGSRGFERVIVGVISNSDDRNANILSSLGVSVGPLGWIATNIASGVTTSDATGSDGNTPADIDFIVTSYESGEEKPHRKIFDFAKERAKKCLERDGSLLLKDTDWTCIHIGDHYEKDYKGAINAGWDSFLLPRDGDGPALSTYRPGSLASVKQIQALTDIFPKLGIDA